MKGKRYTENYRKEGQFQWEIKPFFFYKSFFLEVKTSNVHYLKSNFMTFMEPYYNNLFININFFFN